MERRGGMEEKVVSSYLQLTAKMGKIEIPQSGIWKAKTLFRRHNSNIQPSTVHTHCHSLGLHATFKGLGDPDHV